MSLSIEKMFDHEASASSVQLANEVVPQKIEYETVENIKLMENISYIFAGTEMTPAKLNQLTSKLTCFFEVSLLISKIEMGPSESESSLKNFYRIDEAVFFGKKNARTGITKPFSLPNINLFSVYRTEAKGFFKKVRLNSDFDIERVSLYLIRLSPNYYLAVGTISAEPWAQIKIETLHRTLLKIPFRI